MLSLVLLAQRGLPIVPHLTFGMVVGLLMLLMFFAVVGVVVSIVICLLLYKCYERIPPRHRQMESWQVWLLLIPCFASIWNFFIYPRLARSYQGYFASQGRTDVGDCGERLAFWYAICCVVSIVPYLGLIAVIPGLVLLIVFLVKAWDLRRQIPAGGFSQPS